MRNPGLVLLAFIGVITSSGRARATSASELTAILQEVDARLSTADDWRSIVRIEQRVGGRVVAYRDALVVRRRADSKLLLVFSKPLGNRGQAYLCADRNLYYYEPRAGQWEQVAAGERIAGTNARSADFDRSRLAIDYEAVATSSERLAGRVAQVIILRAKPNADTVFSVVKLWVDQNTKEILKRQDFTESASLLRTVYYLDWVQTFSEAAQALVWYPREVRIDDEVVQRTSTRLFVRSVELSPLEPDGGSAIRRPRLGLASEEGLAKLLLVLGAPPPARPEREAPAEVPAKPADIPASKAKPEPIVAEASGDSARDDANLGASTEPAKLSEEETEKPLTIGGQFYLRAQVSALSRQKPESWSFFSPSLLDAYFDGRPNPRVRGYVLARMAFDPMLPADDSAKAGGLDMATVSSSGSRARTRSTQVAVDQLWLRFDIARTVYATAGKQHVRWGTGHFWTPADFLHVHRRNPLDVFDARSGTTMLKLHLPLERRSWNFYAYGVTEGAGGAPTVADLAGAGRAEIVLGTAELGLGALFQRGRKPKLAADLSAGIGPVDVYGELGLRYESEIDRVGFDPETSVDRQSLVTTADGLRSFLDTRYPVYRMSGVKPQVTSGLTYSRPYAVNDTLTLGLEYFYNGLGYDDPSVYPGLIVPRGLTEPATFFYLGRHYGAVYLTLPSPFSWDLTSFTVSTLANLSDRSAISRLDFSLVLLTHLRFEMFAAVHYGRSQGEFRLGIPELGRAPAFLDLGLALRVNL